MILMSLLAVSLVGADDFVRPMSYFWSNSTVSNSVTFTVNEYASSILAVDVSSNLVDWSEFARFTPQKSPSAFTLEDRIINGGQRFYRAISDPIELQVAVQGDFPLPAGTSVSANPGDVHIDVGQGFDSRTFSIGTRFFCPTGYVSIVVAAPGYFSQTQTVSAVGIRSGGHISFSFTEAHSMAPSSLAGLSFDYGFDSAGTIVFSNNGPSFLWLLPNGTIQVGSYVANRAGSVWSVDLLKDGSEPATASLRIQFTASDSGTLSITPSGVLDGATEPFARSTRMVDANLLPPPTIRSISVRVDPSSLIGGADFSAMFSGGIFIYTQGGGPGLTGPYQYTVTGPNTAHLVLHYTAPFAGDVDDVTLTFNGAGSGTIRGTSISGGQSGVFTGTFNDLR
jgi:hypothetical protein